MIVIVMAPVINRIGDASFCPPWPLIGQMTPVQPSDWLSVSGDSSDNDVTDRALCDSRSLDADYNNIRGTM